MLCSFLMMTYGRCARQPRVLNEAVYWCLQSDHPDVEVVVVNDNPEQKLLCVDKRVRCVNMNARCPDLGMKMNVAVGMALGDVCLVNDDDDISLPHRASQALKMLDGYDVFNPKRWFYCYKGSPPIPDSNGWGYNACAFRRDAMFGKHPPAVEGHDREAMLWMCENLRCNPYTLRDDEISFCYRWRVSDLHLSNQGTVEQVVTAFLTMPPGRPGNYWIDPAPGPTDWRAVCPPANTLRANTGN